MVQLHDGFEAIEENFCCLVSCSWAAPKLLTTKNEKKLSVRSASQHRRDEKHGWKKRETKSCLGSKCCAGPNHETLGIAYGMAAVGNKSWWV